MLISGHRALAKSAFACWRAASAARICTSSTATSLTRHQWSGHEIVGRVELVGDRVDAFEPGERVGIPWPGWSCRSAGLSGTRTPRVALANRSTGGMRNTRPPMLRFRFPLRATYDDCHAHVITLQFVREVGQSGRRTRRACTRDPARWGPGRTNLGAASWRPARTNAGKPPVTAARSAECRHLQPLLFSTKVGCVLARAAWSREEWHSGDCRRSVHVRIPEHQIPVHEQILEGAGAPETTAGASPDARDLAWRGGHDMSCARGDVPDRAAVPVWTTAEDPRRGNRYQAPAGKVYGSAS